MPQAKEKRNALIIRLWNKGKSNTEILTALKKARYKGLTDTHSLSGVISRLKRAGKLDRVRPGQELTRMEREGMKRVSTQTQTSTSTRRMTFWLPVPTIEKIKRVATNQGKTCSALLRDILGKHL